ncbi:translation initiation factor IF-2-like isoform X1 [Cuculus canorus]|uniref:translation initiation factor IF-2-like isoform X1 n=1 Tax=Cuculus canorus TaxID=55661 RepID=UPI0023AA2BC9|nr:translation initiation factor IF-2-like isoform X1 [Cuculus canorus]
MGLVLAPPSPLSLSVSLSLYLSLPPTAADPPSQTLCRSPSRSRGRRRGDAQVPARRGRLGGSPPPRGRPARPWPRSGAALCAPPRGDGEQKGAKKVPRKCPAGAGPHGVNQRVWVSLLFQSPLEAALGAGAPMGVVRDLSRGAGGPSQGAARARGGDAGGPGRLAPSPGLVVAAVKPGPAGSRFDKSRGACPSFISLF